MVRHNLSARPSGVWLRAVFELRHEEAAAHGLNHRWRHEDAAHHSTLTLRKVRAVLELQQQVELSFEQRPRGCGPSSNYNRGVWVRQTDPVC